MALRDYQCKNKSYDCTCTHTHTHTEGALTTTASIPVMTVPDEAIPNTVVVEINGFTPSTVTIYNYVTLQFNQGRSQTLKRGVSKSKLAPRILGPPPVYLAHTYYFHVQNVRKNDGRLLKPHACLARL